MHEYPSYGLIRLAEGAVAKFIDGFATAAGGLAAAFCFTPPPYVVSWFKKLLTLLGLN